MKISERIFELIKDRGMTQKEFSDKTGIPQSTISDWKGKDLNPSADKLLVICQVLHTSVYDLLASSDKNERYPMQAGCEVFFQVCENCAFASYSGCYGKGKKNMKM